MAAENLTQRAQVALADEHITRRKIGDLIHAMEQAGLTLTAEYAELTLAYSDAGRGSAAATQPNNSKHALCGR